MKTTYRPVMNPVLETVVRSSPAVCSAYPAARSVPSAAPASQPSRPSAAQAGPRRHRERGGGDREADREEGEERVELERVLDLDEGQPPDGRDGDEREEGGHGANVEDRRAGADPLHAR